MTMCATRPQAPQRHRWPLASSMPPLAALPTVPALARAFVHVTLPPWGLAELAELTELLTSELVTNAVNASADRWGHPVYTDGQMPVIRVALLSDRRRLVTEVWDTAPGVPVLKESPGLEESGRGLLLVAALAVRWGWVPAPASQGKVVWAEMSLLALPRRVLAAIARYLVPEEITCTSPGRGGFLVYTDLGSELREARGGDCPWHAGDCSGADLGPGQ